MQASPFQTDIAKRRGELALYDEELGKIDRIVGELKKRRELMGTPTTQQGTEQAASLDKGIGELTSQSSSIRTQRAALVGAGDPESYVDQWGKAMTAISDQWGSWAQQTARAFSSVFNTAISSISDGITGLIMGTKSWGQALVAIGNTIMTTVIQSIVEMGVRWVMTRGVVGLANIMWSSKEAIAAAPKALMDSISSYGVAALVGAAAFAGVMAMAGGFADGGWVSGPGGPREDRVLARLSPQEFVVNADAASRYGPLLEAMNSGGSIGDIEAMRSSPTVNVAAPNHTFHLYTDLREAIEAHIDSPNGQSSIVRVVQRNRTKVGIGT